MARAIVLRARYLQTNMQALNLLSSTACYIRRFASTHLAWHLGSSDDNGISLDSLAALHFQGVHPRVDVCKGKGFVANAGVPRKPALRGLWYVSMCKDGTLQSATNYLPWVNYSPCAAWLGSLWDEKNLSHELFLTLSAEFRTGHATRKRGVEAVRRQELEAAVDHHVDAEIALVNDSDPLRRFVLKDAIDGFIASFGQPQRRRCLLVLVGGTNTGKSLMCAHVLQKIATKLDVPSFLEVTVEANDELDLSSFDHREHAGVLLDGVGDALTLWRHREVLQGQPLPQ